MSGMVTQECRCDDVKNLIRGLCEDWGIGEQKIEAMIDIDLCKAYESPGLFANNYNVYKLLSIIHRLDGIFDNKEDEVAWLYSKEENEQSPLSIMFEGRSGLEVVNNLLEKRHEEALCE